MSANAPAADPWGAVQGESLDIAQTFGITEPADPRTDGSVFTLALLDPVNTQMAWLTFSTANTVKSCAITNWDGTSIVTLLFRASVQQLLQVPPGAYTGTLFQTRPRDGNFGPQVTAIATVTLTVQAP